MRSGHTLVLERLDTNHHVPWLEAQSLEGLPVLGIEEVASILALATRTESPVTSTPRECASATCFSDAPRGGSIPIAEATASIRRAAATLAETPDTRTPRRVASWICFGRIPVGHATSDASLAGPTLELSCEAPILQGFVSFSSLFDGSSFHARSRRQS